MQNESYSRDTHNILFKEDFDYEGRVRVEKHKDQLQDEYEAYLAAHPEVNPMLHDIVHHLLTVQPEEPLKELQSYVRSRRGL